MDFAAPLPPDPAVSETRHFDFDGKDLRLSLETTYWRGLEDIAHRESDSVDNVVKQLRARVAKKAGIFAHEVTSNELVSAIHILVVTYFRQSAARRGPTLLEEALMDIAGDIPDQANQ
nr:ribbon-helix-helix domain-containing protein [Azospirillum sp. SYSU D00513]